MPRRAGRSGLVPWARICDRTERRAWLLPQRPRRARPRFGTRSPPAVSIRATSTSTATGPCAVRILQVQEHGRAVWRLAGLNSGGGDHVSDAAGRDQFLDGNGPGRNCPTSAGRASPWPRGSRPVPQFGAQSLGRNRDVKNIHACAPTPDRIPPGYGEPASPPRGFTYISASASAFGPVEICRF